MSKESNFTDHKVVSAKKSGVRIIRLTLSSSAKRDLASKSSGIRSTPFAEGEKRDVDMVSRETRPLACKQ